MSSTLQNEPENPSAPRTQEEIEKILQISEKSDEVIPNL
jgi:hypothetical protein